MTIEMKFTAASDLIELEPFGVTAGMDHTRPVMLFREKDGEAVLPVWMSPLDAGIALSQHNTQSTAKSPHDVTLQAMEILGVKPVTCHFTEIKGHQQYAEVAFSGSRKLRVIKTRADYAVSFCLQAKVKFYCTRGFLAKCREVEVEINQLPPPARNEKRPRNQYLN
jgi:hypothetical protein